MVMVVHLIDLTISLFFKLSGSSQLLQPYK